MRELPPDDVLPQWIDAIVPGLDKVAASHFPLIRRWPGQVSRSGFAHLFFSNARLPAQAARGRLGRLWPACSNEGPARDGRPDPPAAQPNSLGQTIIDEEHKWLGCLRVKWGSEVLPVRYNLINGDEFQGKRIKRTRLIQGGRFVVAVGVEMVIPPDDPSEPCYESETVQLLREWPNMPPTATVNGSRNMARYTKPLKWRELGDVTTARVSTQLT